MAPYSTATPENSSAAASAKERRICIIQLHPAIVGSWLSANQPPTPHRTETKKSEANQAEGRGFGDGVC